MNLLLGALAEGFLLTALALSLYVSWRLYQVLDLTQDGAFTVGGAATAALLVKNVNPLVATAFGGLAGMGAGAITGFLATRLRINASLIGVLLTSGLYSVTLLILGGGTLSLSDAPNMLGDSVTSVFVLGAIAVALTVGMIFLLGTNLGLAMRASGENPAMARSVGVKVDRMLILGLGLANGLVGISGALEAQFLGYANVQIGVGAVVTGLATLLIGEALTGTRPLWRWVG